jgi:hypothetical protein
LRIAAAETVRCRLASQLPRRWAHIQGVGRRATVAASIFDPGERSVLISAALLHDLGYAPDLAVTGFHPLDGARYLARIGTTERVVNLVARHSCAVKEAELRGLSDKLLAFADEETPLRDALWWADMTTTPDGEVTNVEQRFAEIEVRYGPEHLVTTFIRRARSELVGAVERTEARLRAAGIDYQ